ncbi:MAG TPA: hypothetical protein VGR87_12755 [Candidatus Limnocylindria bacterium]|nr:hypothetical protein [Candidatus Limnocylindria bacterium]
MSLETSGADARRRIGNLVSPVFYRFALGPTRPRRVEAFADLLEAERLPLERQRELQQRLLRKLLLHATRNSAWYRERLPDPSDLARFHLDDLRRLPVLEKSDLQDHLDEITGAGRLATNVGENHSSGSTGTPVRVYQSQEYFDAHWAETAWGYLMCGQFSPGMPLAFFWGSQINASEHRGVRGTLHDLLVNVLWFDAFSLRRDRLPATVRKLRAYRPSLIVGYVSTLTEVAHALHRPLEGLLGLETTAETLTPPDRALLESAFGAPVFNRYGTNEVGTIAHECQAHDGLHLMMQNSIIEVVDAEGRPLAAAGDEGEILVTSLRNLATPLIRYRLGDVVRLGRDGCSCGRGSARLESVVGRSSDLIVSPGGVLLHSLFFLKLFYGTPVQRFRVEQETHSRLRVRVVPKAQYSDDVRRRVSSQILAHGDPGFEVIWEVVDELPRTAGGKFRVTVSHVGRGQPPRRVPTRGAA